ncbi:MAG: SDR family oxidoreductase [Candidatus Omnitrophota bacterium]|nr:MAG: SDR family oxidoreductase [Candidatus Omnitrophota bacterium]
MNFGISDKRVLVVGTGKGIGGAVARAFAAEGCRVSMVARNPDTLKQLLEEMGGLEKGHRFLTADLLEAGAPTRVVKEFSSADGPFDIVVHNVGGAITLKDPLGPVEDWMRVWRFNVGIAIEMNALLVPPMRKQGWGRVIHISSISAELGEPRLHPYGGALSYAAAKAYLNVYVRGLGREVAKENVIVTALMPGPILSEGKYVDKLRKTNPELMNNFLRQHCPIGRFGMPEEIAPFAVFMASEQASYASGSIVPIDGGRI